MNKIAILPLKEMPKNCLNCIVTCKEFDNKFFIEENSIEWYEHNVLPNCPLISIDIDELEEAIKQQELILDNIGSSGYKIGSSWKVIKDLIDKLKGVE